MAEIIYIKFWKIIKLLRRFGKLLLTKGRQVGSISISQVIEELRYCLFEKRNFDVDKANSHKADSLNDNQPFVIQILQMSEREKLGIDDQYGLRLLSALSDKNRFYPKEEPVVFENGNSPNTRYAIHARAFSTCVWANRQDTDALYGQNQKPGKVLRAYYFLWLLSHLSKEIKPSRTQSVIASLYNLRKQLFNNFYNHVDGGKE